MVRDDSAGSKYNSFGQKTSETNLNGVVTKYTYGDTLGDLTQVVQDPSDGTAMPAYAGLDRTTSMSYDYASHVLSSTDPNGATSHFYYNTLGQPTSAGFPSTSGTVAETIGYSYAANGRTTAVTDNRGTTSMSYEAGSDRVSSVTDPVTGTMTYTYLRSGERLSVASADGAFVQNYTYETPLSGTTTGVLPVSYLYDAGMTSPDILLPKDDPNSVMRHLIRITDGNGRKVDVFSTTTGGAMSVRYNQTVNPSSGAVSSYVEDDTLANGFIHTTGRGESYYPASSTGWLQRKMTLWRDLSGSATTSFTSGTSIPYTRNLHENDYTYDNTGQRLTNTISTQPLVSGVPETDGSGHAVLDSREEDYGYDALNRLTSVDYGDGQTQGYSFDAMGNRATKSDSSTGGESYGYDAANRLTDRTVGGNDNPVYSDDDGNTLLDLNASGNSRYSTWDSQNRLTACTAYASDGTSTTSAFTYGSDGLRRRGVVTNYASAEVGIGPGGGVHPLHHPGGTGTANSVGIAVPDQGAVTGSTQTDYIYDGTMMVEQVLRHFDATGAALDTPTQITYMQGPSGPLYRKSSLVADPSWYVYDGLGSVVGEVDVTGNMVASKDFDVYGLTRNVSGTPTTRQGFVVRLGHESDDETGLVYMRARYYDPGIGRFMSEDAAKNGNSWFVYCDNNPVGEDDYSGKSGASVNRLIDLIDDKNAYSFGLVDAGIVLVVGLLAFRGSDPFGVACLEGLALMYGTLSVYAFAIAFGTPPDLALDGALGSVTAGIIICALTGARGAGQILGSTGAGLAAPVIGAAFCYTCELAGAMIDG